MVAEMGKVPPVIASSILLDQTLRDDRPNLAAVTAPTLVLFGDDPKLTDPAVGRWMSDQIPGATFTLMPASSHCPFYEQADIFNEAVLAFTASLGA
jgi:pimeloyl-ACP methyl ester carboxylesterase